MRGINTRLLLLGLALIFWHCEKEPLGTFADESLNYVRFSLMTDANGRLVRDITERQNAQELEFYRHNSLDTIFVPVALSTAPRTTEVDIAFAVTSSAPQLAGDLYTGLPLDGNLRFAAKEHIQFIAIALNRVWEASEDVELHLELASSSDPLIGLGYPRDSTALREVTVAFGGTNIVNKYCLDRSTYELTGADGDSISVRVEFSIPALRAEIGESPDLLEIVPAGICNDVADPDYSIELEEFSAATSRLTYRIAFPSGPGPGEQFFYLIRLRDDLHPRYDRGALSEAAIVQSPVRARIDFDAAGLFVSPSDPFNRLFGYAWYFNENEAICDWQKFSTFTQRVAVAPDSEFDNGQGFHKFRLAHRGSNVGTNPFNTRRYYSNASVESPAYWLEEALELFPRDATSGDVRVIPHNLEFIRRSDDQSVFIPVCGDGTYFYNAALDAFQIDLEVYYDESGVGGPPSVTHYMTLFNREVDAEPPPSTQDCVAYREL